jgi:hypothetical protein
MRLEHPGIYRAFPVSWGLGQQSDNSQSMPVVIEFRVTARSDGGEWTDLTGYEDQTISGYFYIVGREGNFLARTMENLAAVIGWSGDCADLLKPPPPAMVQIVVEQQVYNGKTSLKVQYLNPYDFAPGPRVQDATGVQDFRKVFGAQMKATAAAVIKANGGPAPKAGPPPPPPAKSAPPPQEQATTDPEDGLPF